MPTLYQTIAEKFLARLAESKEIDGQKINELRTLLLAEDKRVKSEELVKVFSAPAGGDIK